MYIKNLLLKDFRNYEDKKFEFSPHVNVIIGKNAKGKTNILEAIFFMIIGKSFRTSHENEVIKWEKSCGYIKGDFAKQYRDIEVEMFFNESHKKAIKIDGINIKRMNFLNTITFSAFIIWLLQELINTI